MNIGRTCARFYFGDFLSLARDRDNSWPLPDANDRATAAISSRLKRIRADTSRIRAGHVTVVSLRLTAEHIGRDLVAVKKISTGVDRHCSLVSYKYIGSITGDRVAA